MSLLAGAASRDITPRDAKGLYLAGFGAGRTALGVLDPLEVCALYLREADTEVALVTVDCIGLNLPTVQAIRERVSALADESIIIAATHTHSAPDTIGMWGPAFLGLFPKSSGVDPEWLEHLVESAAEALVEARETAQAAQLKAATIPIDAAWTRNDRKGGGRYDDAVALALDSDAGARIATLLNFASHPEALWDTNRLVSAEHPGYFRARMRELSPGVPLYFSGPLGGMLTPNVPEKSDEATRRAYVRDLGHHLAEVSHAALAEAPASTTPHLEHRAAPLVLPNGNRRFSLLSRLKLIGVQLDEGKVQTEVHHLRVGDVQALTAPGEMLPELGHRVRSLMDAPHRLLLGLAIDELGYILPVEQFNDREYRYERSMSLGRETADRLVAAQEALLS
ncbi:MAG: hypothetical protein QF464_11695 [Myxococcota bacterium]|nr:hypothetical protein [Myxococcota bacterium]